MYLPEENTPTLTENMSRFRQRKLLSCGNIMDNLYWTLHPVCPAAVH